MTLPTSTVGFGGVTTMLFTTGAVTVSSVEPLTDPEAAVMVVGPCCAVVARPVAEIVAMMVLEDDHTTSFVTSTPVAPPPKLAVAMNCSGLPFGTLGFTGVTVIELRSTLRTAVADILVAGSVAVIVTVPSALPVATPPPVEIVATLALLEAQLTGTALVLPSL